MSTKAERAAGGFLVSFDPQWCLDNLTFFRHYTTEHDKLKMWCIGGWGKDTCKRPRAYIITNDMDVKRVREGHVQGELDRAVPITEDDLKRWVKQKYEDRVLANGISRQ